MTDTYRHLPEPDLDRLQEAFIARDAEVLGRLLVATALNTRDNSIVLDTALRSVSEIDDTFVVVASKPPGLGPCRRSCKRSLCFASLL